MQLPARRAWIVCLIISELVTNAARHAFAECDGGEVIVDVRQRDGALLIAGADDGQGRFSSPGCGAGIIDALAEELGGVLRRNHSPRGYIIVIKCPAVELESEGKHA